MTVRSSHLQATGCDSAGSFSAASFAGPTFLGELLQGEVSRLLIVDQPPRRRLVTCSVEALARCCSSFTSGVE